MRYYSVEELASNPSTDDGVPMELFETVRGQCIKLSFAAVEKLSLPVVVAARAAELWQRFFQKRSLLRNDRLIVTTACIIAATKVQQVDGKHKNIKDILYACFDAQYGYENNPLRFGSRHHDTFHEVKQLVVKAEEVILFDIIGFHFDSELPYSNVVRMVHKFGFDDLGDQHSRAIQHLCWCLANDSIQTNLCLRYTGEVIARGILMAASQLARLELAPQAIYGSGDANELAVALPEIVREILDLYE
ncbi:hypothetical protein BSKO_10253 [Bryopsis sp. KO-2023]|nr:hypothetical protein BSKO_10253 [Bryopsis sp. KO-2023]